MGEVHVPRQSKAVVQGKRRPTRRLTTRAPIKVIILYENKLKIS